MVRIIPWSLPPVKGGSIGGYTPKVDPEPPAPEPEPEPEYYDISNVLMVRTPSHGSYAYDLTVKISGIVIDDLTGAASAKIMTSYASSSSQASADSATKTVFSNNVTNIFAPNATYAVGTHDGYNHYFAVGEIDLVVYNGNGEVLETYVLTEDLDGGE